MSKIKYFFSFLTLSSLCMSTTIAQDVTDYEKEFEAFKKQQQQEYQDFKNKSDEEFATFLKQTWEEFKASAPEEAPTRPEPDKAPVFDNKKTPLPPVEIKPVEMPKTPEKPYAPVKIDIPVINPQNRVNRVTINFYETPFQISITAIKNLNLCGNTEADVSDAWSKLCKSDYEQLISDCMQLKKEKQLNDWAYILLTKKIGEQILGTEKKDEIAFLQMFILSKSGYKVRLSKINEKLKLMIAPASTLYGMPYITLNGIKYYVFNADKNEGAIGVYTYKQDFADAKNLIRLQIDAIPDLTTDEFTETVFSKNNPNLKVNSVVNKNLIAFYKDYPQCDVAIYYKTPISKELQATLYPTLKAAITGKSQKDAANILLDFVQNAFKYQTDGEQFGYEKPFFMDENFFYPACDCEDRAILYANIVKDLLGLDTVLLDYPNHIASAVCFQEDIGGDYLIIDGKKYIICDPTFIGAPIGKCMDQFKQVSPKIIR